MDAAKLAAAGTGRIHTPKGKFPSTVHWPHFSLAAFAVGNTIEVNTSEI